MRRDFEWWMRFRSDDVDHTEAALSMMRKDLGCGAYDECAERDQLSKKGAYENVV